MRISESYLRGIITEEVAYVILENKKAALNDQFANSYFINSLIKELKLSKRQARLLREGIMSKMKDLYNSAKKGVKFLLQKLVNIFEGFFLSYGIAETAKGAIGLVLTQTDEGKAWMQEAASAVGGVIPQFQDAVDWLMSIPVEQMGTTLLIGLASLFVKFIASKGFRKLGFEKQKDMATLGGAAAGTAQATVVPAVKMAVKGITGF